MSTRRSGKKKAMLRAGKDKECLVFLVTEINRFCKLIVSQGKKPARDGVRIRLLLDIVDQIHNLSKCHENRELCQEVVRRMKDGSREEMDLHILRIKEGAEQERKGKWQESHEAFVEKLIQSAEGGAKVFHQVPEPTPGEEGQHSSRRLKKMRLRVREFELSFKSGPSIGKLEKRCRLKISLEPGAREQRNNFFPPLKVTVPRRAAAAFKVSTRI